MPDNSDYRVEIVSEESRTVLIAKVRPALIIVDMSTQDFNGAAFIESLHRNPSAVRLPVVMINTQDLPDSEQRVSESLYWGNFPDKSIRVSFPNGSLLLPLKEA